MLRTSLILAAIAAALLGYILVFERGSITTGELEQRKGSALPEFVRARVSKLEIQRKGVTTVLERDLEADPEDDAALWRVSAPYKANADEDAVDTLLGELEWIDGRRRLEGISEADRKKFGLTAPRYRVWFSVGKVRVPLAVGGESGRGDGVYVSTGEPGVVYVVGKPFVEALEQEPGHFHSKELHEGVQLSTTAGLTLRDAHGERVVRKRNDGLWNFERGASGLASVPAVQALIDAADGLRAKRFIADNVKDLARYGLDKPKLELTVDISQYSLTKKDAQGKAVREQLKLGLLAGKACDGHAGESYLTVAGTHSVYCVADEELAKLDKPTPDLREPRLLPIEDDEIAGVELEHGKEKLVLKPSGEGYTYELSRGGVKVASAEAHSEAVLDWFKALRAVQAVRFDAPKGDAAGAAIKLRVLRKDRPVFEVRAQPAGSSELVAARADEPQAVVFPVSAIELLRPEAARFRPLKLLSLEASGLERLEIRRGAETERVARTGGGFAVQAPVAAPADSIAASEVARLLGSLEALRFVADSAEPSHGLADPSVIVTADFAAAAKDKGGAPAPKRVTLRLGAATEGGRYAQIEGDAAVFVLSSQLADLLSAPLVSRTLLATPLEDLRAVEVVQGASHERVERQATTAAFAAAAGSRLTPGQAQALAEAVATLRATRVVGYGAAAPEYGLQKPAARVEVVAAQGENGAEQRHTIALGAEVDGGRYARRSDQPVTFLLSKEAVAGLLLTPATSPEPSN